MMKPIMCIVGTRPNYMKVAPILAAFADHVPPINYVLVHTGQHYDTNMEKVFFDALGAPAPLVNLKAGAGSHAIQTGEIMKRLDPVVDEYAPSAMLVLGDVNSTLAAALVAAKRNLPLIHVESGLRSGDRTMPEEVNRIITDQLSDLLFTTERAAQANLMREGITEDRIRFVGNVMIDSLEKNKAHAISAVQTLEKHGVLNADHELANGYAVVTLHRPSNVDDPDCFGQLISALNQIALDQPIIFPIHPRTLNNLDRFDLRKELKGQWHIISPQGYFEMIGLMRDAQLVCTDSGGIQEETTMLGVPCLTLRLNTERPITIEQGTNQLVGTDPEDIVKAYRLIRESAKTAGKLTSDTTINNGNNTTRPELWDGRAAQRIAQHIWESRAALRLV
jgi:UDP-N-acetylglucosamine 2-epimerase (non-hydrolysing)